MTTIVGGLSVEKTHNNSDQKKDDQKETTFHLNMSGKNSEFKVNETSFVQRRDDINKKIEVTIVLQNHKQEFANSKIENLVILDDSGILVKTEDLAKRTEETVDVHIYKVLHYVI